MNAIDNNPKLWKTRYGTMMSLSPNSLAARSLEIYGEWLEQELDLLSSFVQEGHTVLEFGGDYGAHTLWLSRTVGDSGEVHVAEPRRIELQQLCANLALNGLTNVHTNAAWLGRQSGHAALKDLLQGGDQDSERALMISVDSLELESLHLIKVNRPGTLAALLAGADATVRRHRPNVYFRLGTMDQAMSEVKLLKDLGYRCWSHLPYLYNGENFAGNTENIYPGGVYQSVIAAPIEGRLEFDRLREI
jgi:FkbM family methyltransferase